MKAPDTLISLWAGQLNQASKTVAEMSIHTLSFETESIIQNQLVSLISSAQAIQARIKEKQHEPHD